MIGRNLTGERRTSASHDVAGLWLNSQLGSPGHAGAEAEMRVSNT